MNSLSVILNQPSIWAIVASHLPPMAYMCLARASAQFWRMSHRCNLPPKLHFERALQSALLRYFEGNDTLAKAVCTTIKPQKAHLTGSFLLAVLNGDDVTQHCNDIDIVFVSESLFQTACEILSVLKDTSELKWVEYDSDIGLEAYETFEVMYRKFVQLLNARHENVRNYLDTFDLDFCANAWDGERLIIRNAKAVISRSTFVDIKHAYFDPLPPMITGNACVTTVLPKKIARINKYELRGYHVLTHRESSFINGHKRQRLMGQLAPAHSIHDRVVEFEERWNYFWSTHIQDDGSISFNFPK